MCVVTPGRDARRVPRGARPHDQGRPPSTRRAIGVECAETPQAPGARGIGMNRYSVFSGSSLSRRRVLGRTAALAAALGLSGRLRSAAAQEATPEDATPTTTQSGTDW